jgi:hypothetical protein
MRNIGRIATERAGASESTASLARTIEVVTNYNIYPTSAKMPFAERVNVPFFDIFKFVGDEVTSL